MLENLFFVSLVIFFVVVGFAFLMLIDFTVYFFFDVSPLCMFESWLFGKNDSFGRHKDE